MTAPTEDNPTRRPGYVAVAAAPNDWPADSQERALGRLWLTLRIVWGDRWVVIGGLVAGLIGGMVHASMNAESPRYEATARLYVARHEPRVLEGLAGVLSDSRDHVQTQVTLLKSTTILADTLLRPEVRQMGAVAAESDRVDFLKRNIRVIGGRTDDIIEVAATLGDPTDSARLVNAVVDSYIAYHESLRRTTAAELIRAMEGERTKLEAELAERRAKVLAFERESGVGGGVGGAEAVVGSRMAGLIARATELNTQAMAARSLYDAAEAARHDTAALRRLASAAGAEAVGGGAVETEAMMSPLRRELAELRGGVERYGPRSQVRIDMERRIAELEIAIARQEAEAADLFVDRLHERCRLAEEAERQTQAAIEAERAKATSLHESGVELDLMRRDMERAERLYDTLATKLATINLSDSSPTMKITVLDRATPSSMPQPIRRSRSVGLGAAAGLMAGLMLVGMKNTARRRLRTSEQIAAALGAPVVGVVPRVVEAMTPNQVARIVLERPCGQAAEACRAIRTALLFGSPSGPSRTIVVTSPTAGMGKSTVASNLAIAIAQSGRRTLLLDADFRKPRQHRVFAVKPTRTLADLVADSATVAIDDLVCATGVAGLDVLACGSPTSHPSEALASPAFAALFEELRRRYAVIVIDSVPALSATDVQIVAAMADVTLFVVKPSTLARQVEQSRRALEAVGASLFGAVVNGVSPFEMGSHGFGAYGGYEYGYEDQVRAA